MNKTYITIAVVIAIIAAIIGLEAMKPEQSDVGGKEISILQTQNASAQNDSIIAIPSAFDEAHLKSIQQKDAKYPKAIELESPDGYINSEPFSLSQYIGKKVIIVDFWTYSCINCQRTIPYLNAWNKQYEDQGLLIVGVHTPEFDFEKDRTNVERAVEKFGITYPVVQDNKYQTWRAYSNRYWPRKYIIDIDGFIVYDHIGEGAYEETEEVIRKLLQERKQVLHESGALVEAAGKIDSVSEQNYARTPEIYFGYSFGRGQIGNKEGWQKDEVSTYAVPAARDSNMFYVDGTWRSETQHMTSVGIGKVYLDYNAKSIALVAGSDVPRNITVSIDGVDKLITVQEHELYQLDDSMPGGHKLVLTIPDGVQVFTFVFG